jgi:hypothetical protein
MSQRHKHLPGPPLAITHVILDDRIASGEAVLGLKPFPYPLGRNRAIGTACLTLASCSKTRV